MLGMCAERAAVSAVRGEECAVDQASFAEGCIQRERGMSFRENEPVAVVVVDSRDVQHPAVERCQQIDDREGGADMADAG